MATLRAYQTLDIREVIRSGGRLVEAEDRIVIRHGDLRASFTGDFHAVPTGTVGDLLGITLMFGATLVFEAAVERSGFTAFDILFSEATVRAQEGPEAAAPQRPIAP